MTIITTWTRAALLALPVLAVLAHQRKAPPTPPQQRLPPPTPPQQSRSDSWWKRSADQLSA